VPWGNATFVRMLRRIAPTLAFALSSLAAFHARAQDKDAAMSADAMAVESSRPLLLRSRAAQNRTGLGRGGVAMIQHAVEQARFDVRDGDFSSPEIPQWCSRSAADAAQKAGDVDVKGQGVVTAQALAERCSSVFAYTLSVSHSCAFRIPKKGKGEWGCTVDATVTIRKARATMNAAGQPELRQDGNFGASGSYTIHVNGDGSSTDRSSAENSAASSAAFSLEREIREVPGFQLRGPIVESSASTADFCLGRDVLELDQPFHVVKLNEAGERIDVGWGKVRSIHDGCTLTDAMQARAGGRGEFDLRPARLETIIGRGDVRAGMTAIEMPSLGVGVGLQGGTTVDPIGASAVRVDVVGEYDLARHVGVSELHAFAHVGVTIVDASTHREVLARLGQNTDGSSGMIGLQGEFGLLRRLTFGRPFVDLGAGFGGEVTRASGTNGEDLLVTGFGGVAKAGLGFQVSPRFALRLLGSARYSFLSPVYVGSSSSSSSSSTERDAGSLPDASGFGVMAGFLYTP
jgi:hypothetical protein